MPERAHTALRVAACFAVAAGLLSGAVAQIDELILAPEEQEAFEAARRGHYVKARELATEILLGQPESVAAAVALGIALHEGEANIPLALRHYQKARQLIEVRLGLPEPGLESLHREVLYLELRALSDLGRYEELLVRSETLRRLYDPQLHSVDVWPLMKLGRVEEARRAIELALASGDRFEEVVARNGLCALEGYVECMAMLEAVQDHRLNPGLAFRNAAVSAALAGRLEEAERLLVESTMHPDEDTNPWRDLVDLYVLEGRLGEALDASRRMIEFGRKLPPRERQYSRADELVAGAQVLLLAGRARHALRATERAIMSPDRASHWSGSEPELQAEGALLHRAIRRVLSETEHERAAVSAWYRRPVPHVRGMWHRLSGWFAGRRVLPLLFEGGLRIKTDPADRETPSLSGPLWLLLDAIEVFGPGPALALVRDVRDTETAADAAIPPKIRDAQLDAMETEARFLRREWDETLRIGKRAIENLPPAAALLRARLSARMAHAAWRAGKRTKAWELYGDVLDRDPGVLRRLGQALPVSRATRRGGTADRAARRLLAGPRFVHDAGSPFALGEVAGALCLMDPTGAALACGEWDDEDERHPERPPWGDEAGKKAWSLLEAAFSPRVDLSQQDLQSLDGTTVVQRGLDIGPLDEMLLLGESD